MLSKITLSAAATVLGLGLSFSPVLHAEETVGEKISEAASDTGKALKKTGRKVQDKTCEWVDGKMQCAGKKVKHKMQNVGDEAKDKMDDLKK